MVKRCADRSQINQRDRPAATRSHHLHQVVLTRGHQRRARPQHRRLGQPLSGLAHAPRGETPTCGADSYLRYGTHAQNAADARRNRDQQPRAAGTGTLAVAAAPDPSRSLN